MKSFRAKMTIMIVLVVLGISFLLSFISYQRARTSLITQMEDNYSVAAQKYALELTSWVNTNGTIIDTLAAEIAVNDISSKDYNTFHNYLKHSNELLNKNGYVYDVYFTYPDNTMVCASDFVADGTVDFVHEREWYTTSALTGELFYSTPYLDSDTLRPVFTISKAVYKDDKLLGVLAADIFVDVLVDMIQNANVEDNSYAFLIDQNLRMIVHPNSIYNYESTPLKVMEVEGAPYAELIEKIRRNKPDEMVFVEDYDGITRGIVAAQMTNTHWYVCIATSKDELAEGVSNLVRGFVAATTIAAIIGILIAIFLARVLDKYSKQEQEYKQHLLKLEKQAADEASKAKSRFLADMSHEIRTPINAIMGMNEMILREAGDSDIQGYSQNIKQSGHNLLAIINGILDFSKIEDGKMEIVPVRYRVSSQITYFINSISDRANNKKLKLNFNIDPNLPSELFGDDTRINQIVINLLTNAVKYTEKGSVTLTIQAREKTDDGNVLIYFEVRDTGIGIKESDMARLFESFERLDVVRNRNIEGTGLGMTITRKLLELMGSELKVESKYGTGSVFSFELWQKIENDKPIGDYRQVIESVEDTDTYRESFHAKDARILVVDDTKMNLLVVENLLKKTGIKMDTALNGPDAIKLADQNTYDVILMDQRMPGMDGTQAMKQIRELESKKNETTPVICLTADVIRGAKDRYMQQGFNDYLTKPVDGDRLEKMLIEYLPGDKVEIVDVSDSESSDHKLDDTVRQALNAGGIDTESGRSFCGHDDLMYIAVLGDFVLESKNKMQNLQNTFDSKDWKNYAVYMHSLKSTSKTIGAKELFELSAKQETAADKEDVSTARKDHDRIMQRYEETVELIKNNISFDDNDDTEDEILVFEPPKDLQ